MTVPGGQEQDAVLSAEEVEAMADAIVEVLADFVPLCNDSEFQAVDRARAYAQELASMVIALRVRADQAANLAETYESAGSEWERTALAAEAEAESLRQALKDGGDALRRIEAYADALTGDETREQLALAAGFMSGVAMASAEAVEAALAAADATQEPTCP